MGEELICTTAGRVNVRDFVWNPDKTVVDLRYILL